MGSPRQHGRLAWLLVALAACGGSGDRTAPSPAVGLPESWPPVVGEPYPDLTLIDQTGTPTTLSSFEGKVILLEPVGMDCPACQAFAGAHEVGSFAGISPQKGLPSAERSVRDYAGVDLDDDRIVYVQLLLYGLDREAPSADDGRDWAAHFGLDRTKGQVVLVGTADLVGPASYNLIPGFQLIDRDFVLRSDSTGHSPRDDLYRTLLPMLPTLLKE